MGKKTFWINTGLSAAFYVTWIIISILLIQIEAISDACFLVASPVLLAGGAYIAIRSGKIVFYPLVTTIIHILLCALILISLKTDLFGMLEDAGNNENGFVALIELFGAVAIAVIYAVIIVAAVVSSAVMFLSTFLTGLIAVKIHDKKTKTDQDLIMTSSDNTDGV